MVKLDILLDTWTYFFGGSFECDISPADGDVAKLD